MDNKEISGIIKLTGKLMELHGENKFKVRSYTNAAFQLGRISDKLVGLSVEELEQVNGIGKSIAPKIFEITTTGKLDYLEQYIQKTPEGILGLLQVKGLGPGKVKTLWNDYEIESPGELLQACEENRLIELKGFGEKTQESIKKALQYTISSAGKYHYATAEKLAFHIEKELKKQHPNELISITGAIRRKCEIVESIDILIGNTAIEIPAIDVEIPVNILQCYKDDFYAELVKTTGSEAHVTQLKIESACCEEDIYKANNLPYIEPELRENLYEFNWAKNNAMPVLVEETELKGILHNHSTWSDGRNTLEEMAIACRDLGKEYLGICDHSKSAFYANGLSEERIVQQHAEIDELNKKLAPFVIYKGIEADILYDGNLDYSNDVLKTFDFVVASVHSQIKMDEAKANERLVKAIENPYTTILGHPTARLLLSREGYPINHKMIIDACAANNVVMELNANPLRLDMDWRHIQYALEKGVKISINPDAHNTTGYSHMYYGVCVARKGGLTKEMTFNALSAEEIGAYFKSKRG